MSAPLAIEAQLITAIGTGTAAGTRVHVGQRLESGALPALIVRVTGGVERAALCEDSTKRLQRADVTVSAVATDMDSAGDLVEAAVANLTTYYETRDGCVIQTGGRTIDDPTSGEGDEAEPYVANQTVMVYVRF